MVAYMRGEDSDGTDDERRGSGESGVWWLKEMMRERTEITNTHSTRRGGVPLRESLASN